MTKHDYWQRLEAAVHRRDNAKAAYEAWCRLPSHDKRHRSDKVELEMAILDAERDIIDLADAYVRHGKTE